MDIEPNLYAKISGFNFNEMKDWKFSYVIAFLLALKENDFLEEM